MHPHNAVQGRLYLESIPEVFALLLALVDLPRVFTLSIGGIGGIYSSHSLVYRVCAVLRLGNNTAQRGRDKRERNAYIHIPDQEMGFQEGIRKEEINSKTGSQAEIEEEGEKYPRTRKWHTTESS